MGGADGVGGRPGYEQLDVFAPSLTRSGRPGSRRARGRLAEEKEQGVLAHGYTCRSAIVWISCVGSSIQRNDRE